MAGGRWWLEQAAVQRLEGGLHVTTIGCSPSSSGAALAPLVGDGSAVPTFGFFPKQALAFSPGRPLLAKPATSETSLEPESPSPSWLLTNSCQEGKPSGNWEVS